MLQLYCERHYNKVTSEIDKIVSPDKGKGALKQGIQTNYK